MQSVQYSVSVEFQYSYEKQRIVLRKVILRADKEESQGEESIELLAHAEFHLTTGDLPSAKQYTSTDGNYLGQKEMAIKYNFLLNKCQKLEADYADKSHRYDKAIEVISNLRNQVESIERCVNKIPHTVIKLKDQVIKSRKEAKQVPPFGLF